MASIYNQAKRYCYKNKKYMFVVIMILISIVEYYLYNTQAYNFAVNNASITCRTNNSKLKLNIIYSFSVVKSRSVSDVFKKGKDADSLYTIVIVSTKCKIPLLYHITLRKINGRYCIDNLNSGRHDIVLKTKEGSDCTNKINY